MKLAHVLTNAVPLEQTTTDTWRNVQARARDTVVQLFVQVARFNWLEPYKTPEQDESFGSGFFISHKGHILTNYHVIAQAIGIYIQIPSLGKEQLRVEIIGSCPERDIALLQLTEESAAYLKKKLGKIPFLQLGDSDKITRTQELLALGYPLAQENLKSTHGIVSGRERIFEDSYIQITAPLNPGNSGGPALDHNGFVIGINTAKMNDAHGVGYIIPINEVSGILEELGRSKLLRKPHLGAELSPATEDLVKSLGNPTPGGIYIAHIYNNFLFDKMGFKKGDMLYQINGYSIDMYGEIDVEWYEDKVDIIDLLNRLSVGDELHAVVYRRGKRIEARAQFELSTLEAIRMVYPEYEAMDFEILGGMVIMELTLNHIATFSEHPAYYHLIQYTRKESNNRSRLIVTHILPNSPAHHARSFEAGDILSHVNEKAVETLADLRNSVAKGSGKQFITFENENGALIALSIKRLLAEEDILSQIYFYKKSPLLKKLALKKTK